MSHRRLMMMLAVVIAASLLLGVYAPGGSADASGLATTLVQNTDGEVPPGNPVIGDDRPGDIEPDNDTRRYVLWGLVAVCLIGAGTLLVKIERWEARRNDDS